MKFLALFLLSALVISASAELNAKAVNDIFLGFIKGMNYGELNPSFENCSSTFNKTRQYANDVVNASQQESPEAFAAAVSSFGFSFAQSIRTCGKAMRLTRALLEIIRTETANLSYNNLTTRFITNLGAFTVKFNALKYAFQHGNFVSAGENLAEITKLFVFNSLEVRTPRQLEEDVEMIDVKSKLTANVSFLTLGLLGFIEVANTTIVVDHYNALVNDTAIFASQFPALQQAIVDGDFSAIISIATTIYKYIPIVVSEFQQIQDEAIAFVQRDLPLFDNEEKIAKAVESLFLDLPTTLANILKISSAYQYADYREVGHGSGAIYNQLRNGAQL